jgi:hypothetical protein
MKRLTKGIGVIWQLPQTVAALLVILYLKLCKVPFYETEAAGFKLVLFDKHPYFGVSFGTYIIAHVTATDKTIQHEIGHCIQSRLLGWLYLPLVGVPSLICNILSRKYPASKWYTNYYGRYPEHWADRLGGVKR